MTVHGRHKFTIDYNKVRALTTEQLASGIAVLGVVLERSSPATVRTTKAMIEALEREIAFRNRA